MTHLWRGFSSILVYQDPELKNPPVMTDIDLIEVRDASKPIGPLVTSAMSTSVKWARSFLFPWDPLIKGWTEDWETAPEPRREYKWELDAHAMIKWLCSLFTAGREVVFTLVTRVPFPVGTNVMVVPVITESSQLPLLGNGQVIPLSERLKAEMRATIIEEPASGIQLRLRLPPINE